VEAEHPIGPKASPFTDRRKAVRRRTDRLETVFSAVMHDLRTPLTAVCALVESLEDLEVV
jgi:K+-sensing histidine kinase KdpD